MNWEIKNNKFLRQQLPANHTCYSIANSIKGYKSLSFYLRGSLLEQETPHANADIDLYVIHKLNYLPREIALDIVKRLSDFNRFVDLHIFNRNELNIDLPNRLLLCSRSIHIGGPEIILEPVNADSKMIDEHWKAYNPYFAPDIMYSSVRSRVCALKNLTRCFGLISLVKKGIFTRDIQECISYAKSLNHEIYNCLQYNWNIVDVKEPLNLKPIKEFLLNLEKTGQLNL